MKEIFYEVLGDNRYSIYESESDLCKISYSFGITSSYEKSFVNNVTSIKEVAFEIMDALIRNAVPPVHLIEVIEDFI
jgi:hypothetical protein